MKAAPTTAPTTLRHHNAFDALRIIAAMAVLFSHSYPLYGLHEPMPMAGQTFGSLAVAIFFALSGYLVCQSWISDASLHRFALRRALRILPGLLVVVMVTALLIGPLFSTLSASTYLQSSAVGKYIAKAFLMLSSPALPGLFEHNPYPFGTNGSLWTLKYEISMYLCLALLGKLVGKTARIRVAFPMLLLAFGALWLVLQRSGVKDIPMPMTWRLGTEMYIDRFAYLGAFFFAGTCALLYRDRIMLSPVLATAATAVLLFIPDATLVMVLLWFVVPYLVCTVAYRSPRFMTWANGYDYSYGIYIYAFPIQQVMSMIGSQRGYPWFAVLLASAFTTVIAAAASWYLIEKPALSFKRYIDRKPGALGRQAPADDQAVNSAKKQA